MAIRAILSEKPQDIVIQIQTDRRRFLRGRRIHQSISSEKQIDTQLIDPINSLTTTEKSLTALSVISLSIYVINCCVSGYTIETKWAFDIGAIAAIAAASLYLNRF